MGSEEVRRRVMRVSAAVIGLVVVWLTVLVFTRENPVDLTVALLVVLVEVLAVAVLSGPTLAVVVALAAVVLVNWYLVPPYGTFAIASADNVVALVVFGLVAAAAATLVEVGARARARAREYGRQAELLSTVVTSSEGDDAATALERVRQGLGLEQVELRSTSHRAAPRVVASAGAATGSPVVLDVALPDGYGLVGRGAELFAPDREFLASLGAAAVRAYESDLLQEETHRAAELEAIDRSRTALLASVGHDLRTPLAGLRLSIDTLQSLDESLSLDDRDALMQTIKSSSDRLDELITNLLDMSRLQAGAVITRPELCDVSDVVDRVLLATPDPRIGVRLPADLPSVWADGALLERIVSNLVSNALRYSDPGAPVTIVGQPSTDAVVLSVIDRGPGIAPEQREAVFEPFHRVGAQPDGGSGLGLAIVRGFSEAMGIDVALSSEPGQGVTVTLAIPRHPPEGGQ